MCHRFPPWTLPEPPGVAEAGGLWVMVGNEASMGRGLNQKRQAGSCPDICCCDSDITEKTLLCGEENSVGS